VNVRGFEVSSLHGLPVVAIAEGRILGKAREAVFDPHEHTLIGLTVSGRNGKGDGFVDCNRIRRLGPYAIVVSSAADVGSIDEHERAREVMSSGIRVRGADVLTDEGKPVGKLDRIWLRDDGRVTRYRASLGGFGLGRSHEIAPEDVVVIGEDVVIVAADAVDGTRPAAQHPGDPRMPAHDEG